MVRRGGRGVVRAVLLAAYYVAVILLLRVFRLRALRKRRSPGWRPWGAAWNHPPPFSVRLLRWLARSLRWPPLAGRPTVDPRMVAQAAARNYEAIQAIARARGQTFVLALQPYLYWSWKPRTAHEERLAGLRRQDRRGTISYAEFADGFRDELGRLVEGRIEHFLDLNAAFDQDRETAFVDTVHLGDRGYRVVADQLAGAILARHPGETGRGNEALILTVERDR